MTFKVDDCVRVTLADSHFSGDEGCVSSCPPPEDGESGCWVNLDSGLYWFLENELELVGAVDPEPADEVNSPDHYTWTKGFEVIDFAEQLNFNLGNVVKYSARAGRKTDDPIRDLEKARWYLDREITRIKEGTSE